MYDAIVCKVDDETLLLDVSLDQVKLISTRCVCEGVGEGGGG